MTSATIPARRYRSTRCEPELLAELVALYEGWAEEKGIVEVRDDWSPWFGFPEDR